MLGHTVPYRTIPHLLCYTVLYCAVLYYATLYLHLYVYYAILCYDVPCYAILHFTVQERLQLLNATCGATAGCVEQDPDAARRFVSVMVPGLARLMAHVKGDSYQKAMANSVTTAP